jgi:hypothetical protein
MAALAAGDASVGAGGGRGGEAREGVGGGIAHAEVENGAATLFVVCAGTARRRIGKTSTPATVAANSAAAIQRGLGLHASGSAFSSVSIGASPLPDARPRSLFDDVGVSTYRGRDSKVAAVTGRWTFSVVATNDFMPSARAAAAGTRSGASCAATAALSDNGAFTPGTVVPGVSQLTDAVSGFSDRMMKTSEGVKTPSSSVALRAPLAAALCPANEGTASGAGRGPIGTAARET